MYGPASADSKFPTSHNQSPGPYASASFARSGGPVPLPDRYMENHRTEKTGSPVCYVVLLRGTLKGFDIAVGDLDVGNTRDLIISMGFL